MSWKAKYYEVFGLTENATKSEVKRQYRKLAMKFHPDRNPDPKAHKLFLDLTEAYQILMDDSAVKPTRNIRDYTATSTKTAAEQRQERYRQGQERYQEFLRRQKLDAERTYQKFTSGLRWKIFKISSIITLVLSISLLLDKFLPEHEENHMIVATYSTYSGLEHESITKVKTDKDLTMYLGDFKFSEDIQRWPVVTVYRSHFLHNPIRVKREFEEKREEYFVDFSVVNIFPIFFLFFLFPTVTYVFRKNNGGFYMCYFFSQYVVCSFALYVLITQYRWLHLLTFGFI